MAALMLGQYLSTCWHGMSAREALSASGWDEIYMVRDRRPWYTRWHRWQRAHQDHGGGMGEVPSSIREVLYVTYITPITLGMSWPIISGVPPPPAMVRAMAPPAAVTHRHDARRHHGEGEGGGAQQHQTGALHHLHHPHHPRHELAHPQAPGGSVSACGVSASNGRQSSHRAHHGGRRRLALDDGPAHGEGDGGDGDDVEHLSGAAGHLLPRPRHGAGVRRVGA